MSTALTRYLTSRTKNYYKRKYYKVSKALRRTRYAQRQARQAMGLVKGTPESIAKWGKNYSTATPEQRQLRALYNYRGEGDYKDWLKWISRIGGGIAGGALGLFTGGPMGAATGAVSGWEMGRDYSKAQGWGDYGVGVNQLMGDSFVPMSDQQNVSVNRTSSSGDIFIEHTEFVQNIYASVTSAPSTSSFQITQFQLNPGLCVTFPFLSQLACSYDLYEFQGLIFQYKPTSGEYGNNSSNSIGKVILATQYDPDAPAFLNAVQMENYDYANSCKPSCGALHGVETAPQQRMTKLLYIRTGVSTKDKVNTDLGTFYIATEGIPFGGSGAQTAQVGELWVTYRIRLSRANLYQSLLGGCISTDSFLGTCSDTSPILTTVASTKNSIGCNIASVGATGISITWPLNIQLGYYMIWINIYRAAGNAQFFSAPSAAANLTYYKPQSQLPTSTPQHFPSPGVSAPTSTMISDVVFVKVSAPGNLQASLQLNLNAALSTTGASYEIYITQVNSNNAESTS